MIELEVLKKAKEIYESRRYVGMCSCISESIQLCVKEEMTSAEVELWMSNNIPLFNRDIAIKDFCAGNHVFWWPVPDRENRIAYFDWLISKYSCKD